MRYLFMTIFAAITLIILSSVLWISHDHAKSTPLPDEQFQIKSIPFSHLPGWHSSQVLASLDTFQLSCKNFLQQNPERSVGNHWFQLHAKDWQPACTAAKTLQTHSTQVAQQFFETWFQPVEFTQNKSLTGLFTGYYLPEIEASLTKIEGEYTVPIYGIPNNLIQINLHDFDTKLPSRQLIGRLDKHQVIPYYSRKEIDEGVIENEAPIIAYVRNPLDRLIIEIQGSGVLNFPDGTQLELGYAAKNGLAYTSIGRILIERNRLPIQDVSMQSIRTYLETNPQEQEDIIHQNRSFVFFTILKQKGPFGTQGIRLTQGYSLAVDPDWVPLGMPVWLTTTYPDPHSNHQHPLHRLMIAQDTGGAIKGTVRGDVYWGHSADAAAIAGKMKSKGRYWLLLPKSYLSHKTT